jgi:hypothetical protein
VAKRNISRRRGQGGRNRGDWETRASIWGGAAAVFALGAGAFSLGLVQGIIPAATATGAVPLGRLTVHEVEIYCDVPLTTSTCNANLGFGLYPTQWDSTAGTWTGQFPLNPLDANRDNWLAFEVCSAFFPSPGQSIVQRGVSFQRRVKVNRTFGQGEGLMFVIQNGPNSTGTVYYNYFIRSLVTKVL